MKKLLIAAAALLVGFQAFAQEAEVQKEEKNPLIPFISLSASVDNCYLSDGIVVNPDTMIFGDLYLEWSLTDNVALYGDLWVANDWNDYNKADGVAYEPEEIDYTVGVTYGAGNYKADLSYAYWDMPQRTGWNAPGCTKMVLTLDQTYDIVVKTDDNDEPVFTVTPRARIRNDFENDEWLVRLGAASKWAINDNLTLKNTADMFWGNGRWICGAATGKDAGDLYKNTITTFVLGAELNYAINENFSCGPFAEAAWGVDHEVRDMMKASSANNSFNFHYGFKVAAEF